MCSCKNLNEAFEVARKYILLTGPNWIGKIFTTGYDSHYIYDPGVARQSEALLRNEVEFEFALWFNMAHLWKEPTHWFKEVHFSFPQPTYSNLYTDYFHCPIVYDAPQNKVIFESHYLTKPFTSYDKHIFSIIDAKCAAALDEIHGKTGLEGRDSCLF